jgi:hypothetical protein|tara:strand:+ start:247 stop:429 length:183 start_codon:yes stop_codon:yes gene_type:complete
MIKMHLRVNFQEASMIETALMELIKVVKTRPSPEHIAKLEQLLLEVSSTKTKLYELREEE